MQKDMAVQVTLNGVDKLNPKLKQAIGRVNEITARAKQAQDKLKAISITQNQIRSIEQAREKMRGLGNQIKVAEANAKAAAAQMKLGNATQADLDKATAAVMRLQTEYDRLGRTALDTRSKLNAKGLTGSIDAQRARLQSEQAAAMAALQRQERMQSAQARASAMQSRAGGLAMGGAGLVAGGYAILAPLKAATDSASAFQSKLRQIQITGELTEAQMIALGKSLIDASGKTGQSTMNLLAGNDFLIAAGMKQGLAEKAMIPIGKMATAYKAEVESIAAAVYTLNDSFKIEKFEQAMEIMVKADKNGSVKFKEMAAVAPTLGSGFAAMNMTGMEAVATMSAGLQIARKGAASSDEAANNMKNFMVKVLSPETLKKAQANFGLDLYGVMTNAKKGGGNPMDAAIEAISRVTKGGDQKLLGDLFQDMQVQSFLRPMIQNLGEYKRIKAEALGAAGSGLIDQDFAKSAKDMDIATSRMGNAWENLKTKVGMALEPALQPLIDLVSRATESLVEFTDKHPKLVSVIALVAAIVGVLLVGFGGLMLMLAAILIPMAALTLLSGSLGVTLLPVLLIIGAIALAIAAVVAVFVYWDEIVGYFMGKWEALKIELSTVGTFFASVGQAIIDGLIKPIIEGGVQVVNAILGVVSRGVDAVKAFLGIRSPSRVFAEIGGHTTAGLALGINRGAPAAVESVRRMAAGITVAGAATLSAGMAMAGPSAPGMPGGGSGGAVSIGPVSIVINGTGMDAEAIAKAVDQRLRAMATQAKTEQQARFFDD